MSALSALLLLPAALLLDRLFGEPPARIHPVCGMGALAAAAERLLRRGPDGARMTLAGLAACLAVILPVGLLAALPVLLAGGMLGDAAAWIVCVAVVSLCLAPRCLDEHARRVALPLERGDLEAARRAVAMLVGRDPQQLDAHGVARACVESVGENLTDGILATLFWAAAGLLLAGLPGAAALAACHRAANVLDALWGRLDATYRCFGTAAARLDDVLNWCPARLALPCIVLAAALLPGLDARACRWAGATATPTRAPIPPGARPPLPGPWACAWADRPGTAPCTVTIPGWATAARWPRPGISGRPCASCGPPCWSSRLRLPCCWRQWPVSETAPAKAGGDIPPTGHGTAGPRSVPQLSARRTGRRRISGHSGPEAARHGPVLPCPPCPHGCPRHGAARF